MFLRGWRIRFSLRALLAFVAVLTAIASVLVTAQVRARRLYQIMECQINLKLLGNDLSLYTQEFGGGRDWPGTRDLGDGRGSVPPNVAFWEILWLVPTPGLAVRARRPEYDKQFICPRSSVGRTTTALTYSAPRFSARWPPGSGSVSSCEVFPGGKLSMAVRCDVLIGGDIIGPPDYPNHGGAPGRPDTPWWGLRMDGSVDQIQPGSRKAELYAIMTTGSIQR